jgi:DNA-binding NarL/FixJ family response regulator
MQVLRLVAEGLQNSDIAGQLFLSERTVDHHVAAILGKLSAKSRLAATREAERLGLVPGKLGTGHSQPGH